MTVDPARPLVAEECDEYAGPVKALGLAADLLPQLVVVRQRAQPPVIVVGEGDDVECRDLPRVGEIVGRGAATVGESGMTVEIGPQDALTIWRHP